MDQTIKCAACIRGREKFAPPTPNEAVTFIDGTALCGEHAHQWRSNDYV